MNLVQDGLYDLSAIKKSRKYIFFYTILPFLNSVFVFNFLIREFKDSLK